MSGPSAHPLPCAWPGLLQLICAGEEPLVRCLRDLSSQNGPSFFLPLHEARQVLCHGGLCLGLGLCYRGTSVGGGVHGFESRGKKDSKSQDKRSKGPLEPKWWPKWILIKSQDKRPPTVNALAQISQQLINATDGIKKNRAQIWWASGINVHLFSNFGGPRLGQRFKSRSRLSKPVQGCDHFVLIQNGTAGL